MSHRYNRLPYFVTKSRRIVTKCRWHPEKTASLWIWPDGGYRCLGCRRIGRVKDEPELAKFWDEIHGPKVPDNQMRLDFPVVVMRRRA